MFIFKKNTKIGQSLNYTQIIKKKLNQNIDPNSVISLENLQQKVGIVIVARMTSNRLLGKAIKKILDKSSDYKSINKEGLDTLKLIKISYKKRIGPIPHNGWRGFKKSCFKKISPNFKFKNFNQVLPSLIK